jgi:hypothetical protein
MGVGVKVPVFKSSVEGNPNEYAANKMAVNNQLQNRTNHALAKGGSRKRSKCGSRKRSKCGSKKRSKKRSKCGSKCGSKKRSKCGSRKKRRMLKGGKGVEIASVPTRGLPANTQQQNANTMETLLQQNANSVYDKGAFKK